MSLNDILQATGVAICLLLAVWWIISRVTRRGRGDDCGCGSGCEGCPAKRQCDSRRPQ